MIMPAGLIGFTVLIIRERPKYREYTGHPGATKGKVTVSLQSAAIILGREWKKDVLGLYEEEKEMHLCAHYHIFR